MSPTDDQTAQAESLDLARKAAEGGDAIQMLEYLVRSGLLDGLKRRLAGTRGADDDVDYAIALATDELFELLSTGKGVRSIAAFLVKVARRRLTDRHRLLTKEGAGRLHDDLPTDSRSVLDDLLDAEVESHDAGKIRREAFGVIRGLLPRIGQANVQRVMEVIVDAAEENVMDLPDKLIADTLGMSVDVAKKSRQRGFQRLERIARDEGLGVQILVRVGADRADDDQDEKDDDRS